LNFIEPPWNSRVYTAQKATVYPYDFTAYAAEPVLSEVEGLRMNGKNLGSGKVPFVLSVARAKSKHEQNDLK
jgi:hypothetical protein